MRRDRLTFAMMIGVPIMQLILFGFVINSDPKALPTAVLSADNSFYSRTLVRAIENSGYFRVVHELTSEAEAERALAMGRRSAGVLSPGRPRLPSPRSVPLRLPLPRPRPPGTAIPWCPPRARALRPRSRPVFRPAPAAQSRPRSRAQGPRGLCRPPPAPPRTARDLPGEPAPRSPRRCSYAPPHGDTQEAHVLRDVLLHGGVVRFLVLLQNGVER
jgi:hypothetical protein